jgi:kynurenine formamidase
MRLPTRGLMKKTAFDPSYTGITKDGAEWIVANSSLKFVGIDYLSVAYFADLIGPHVALLQQVPMLPLGPCCMQNLCL